MLNLKCWSKRRWIACGAAGLALLCATGVAASKAYRSYTLPARIAQGKVLFEHAWTPNDPLSGGGDGLGPVFNEKSCVACHFQGGVGGGGSVDKNVLAFEVLPTQSRPEVLGGVVHASATRNELLESLQLVAQRYPVIQGAVTVTAGCTTIREDFNPLVHATINTPALFGAGLIDGLSGWSLRGEGFRRSAQLISDNLGGDFTGTTLGRLRTHSGGRAGKFGWKGQFATLKEFVATACAVEVGLTNPQNAQIVPREFREDENAALDMTSRQLDELISYVAALPRPVEVLPDDSSARAQAMRGKAVFAEVGCAECHTPDVDGIEGVYSDFRLYELEPERSANYRVVSSPEVLPHGHPKPSEWKTPPLWGVADSAPYFHDGGSPTLESAIVRHEGQAKQTTKRYKRLPPTDRMALLAFLGTLKAPQAPAP